MNDLIEGRVWVVGDSVSTDAMYPGFAMKMPLEEAAMYVFYELRPGWSEEVAAGDIVVAGRNFGIGSSRAVAALFVHLGVQALVANEFNSLFLRNAINHGLPALTVPGAVETFSDGDTARVNLAEGWCENVTSGARLSAQPLPDLVRDILSAGGLVAKLAVEGYLATDGSSS